MKIWDQVRILIIDDFSFSTGNHMDKLNAHLNYVQGKTSNGKESLSPSMIFVGYFIIFAEIFVNCHQWN